MALEKDKPILTRLSYEVKAANDVNMSKFQEEVTAVQKSYQNLMQR